MSNDTGHEPPPSDDEWEGSSNDNNHGEHGGYEQHQHHHHHHQGGGDCPGDYQIFVRNLNGRTTTLTVNNQTTIYDLKNKIRNKAGVAIEQQQLIYNGHRLENHGTCRSYGIRKQSTIEMTGRLRGG